MSNKPAAGRRVYLRRMYMPLVRAIYSIVFIRGFRLWERMGFHLTPNHFYQPVPAVSGLRPELWLRESSLAGIDMNMESQIKLLELISGSFRPEYDSFPVGKTDTPYRYYLNNKTFESVDAEMLYSMIRNLKPGRIIEVGSGYSTYLSAQALLKNKQTTDQETEFTVIDPHPNEVVMLGFPGLSRVLRAKVQDVDLSLFSALGENDILIIDSTHVLTIGNDVRYLYLDVLPNLNKGVIVHIHDIFLPQEYPQDWVLRNYWFWNEQYLLAAFLAFNYAFEVLWAGHLMHLRHPEILEKAFGSYDRKAAIGPGSFWIRRKS